MFLCFWRICVVCLALKLVGPWVELGFSLSKELYKKDLHDSDNHDGVITHLEPDILECEVNLSLRMHYYEQS